MSVTSKCVDAGLIAATCRHGIALRLYNIQGTGERQQYALELLKDIMLDSDCPSKLYILYDIGCSFESYVRSRMAPSDFERLTFAISIFHAYAHKYPCQVLFSPRVIAGSLYMVLLMT
jgi:hypothetical protein